jgi:hypothetical protein
MKAATMFRVEFAAAGEYELPLCFDEWDAAFNWMRGLFARHCWDDLEAAAKITDTAAWTVVAWNCTAWVGYEYLLGAWPSQPTV